MKYRDTEKGGVLGQNHPWPLLPPLCARANWGQVGAHFAELAGRRVLLNTATALRCSGRHPAAGVGFSNTLLTLNYSGAVKW